MILIIAPEDDVHVSYVTKKLDGRGAGYLHFDPQHFPSQAELSVQHDRDGSRSLFLDYRDVAHDLKNVRSVWNRARVRPIADSKVRQDQTWWVAECCARFLSELYECLDCLWLPERPSSDREAFRIYNPPEKTRGANPTRSASASPYNKLHQLELAGRLGFSVPQTLVTNSPDRFLDFFESFNGEIITKRAANSEFRAHEDLASDEALQRWLGEMHLTADALRELIGQSLQLREFRQRLVARRVKPYFEAHRLDFDRVAVFRIEELSRPSAKSLADAWRRSRTCPAVDGKRGSKWMADGRLHSLYAGELPTAFAGKPAGSVVGPVKVGQDFCVGQILRRSPARLDAATREKIEELLFQEWLAEQRSKAMIQWHWV